MKALIEHLVREGTKIEPVEINGETYHRPDIEDLRIQFIEDIRWDLAQEEDCLSEAEGEHRDLVESQEPADHVLREIQEHTAEIARLRAELAEAESFQL